MRKSLSKDVAAPILPLDNAAPAVAIKRVAIFFSGGIDSTYLVYDALRKGHLVYLFYANGTQSPIKAAAEKYARHRIIEALKKMKLPGEIVRDTSIDITKEVMVPSDAWAMTFYWFMSATQVLYHCRVEEIWLGVIWGDELWGVSGYMSDAWSNLMKAISPLASTGKHTTLVYPIANMTKYQVRADLPEKLLKLTWYCEMPRFIRNTPKACGGCLPCLKRDLDNKILSNERTVHQHIAEDVPRFRAFEERRTVEVAAELAKIKRKASRAKASDRGVQGPEADAVISILS